MAGCPLLWLLSVGQATESNSPRGEYREVEFQVNFKKTCSKFNTLSSILLKLVLTLHGFGLRRNDEKLD